MKRTWDKKNGTNRFYRKEQGPIFNFLFIKPLENLRVDLLKPRIVIKGPCTLTFL